MAQSFMLTFSMAVMVVAITILINSAILWGILHILKLKDNRYGKALKIAAVSGIIMFFVRQILISLDYRTSIMELAAIPIITLALNYYLLNKAYKHKTLLIAVAWSVAGVIISNVLLNAIRIILLDRFLANTPVEVKLT